jgi:hypothetical protein
MEESASSLGGGWWSGECRGGGAREAIVMTVGIFIATGLHYEVMNNYERTVYAHYKFHEI